MKNKNLDEMIATAKNINLNLPVEVTCTKHLLSDGRYGYVFNHVELGQLGRLLFIPHSTGQTQLTSEVSGDPDDPMTQRRLKILEPITKDILNKMGIICGDGTGAVEPYVSPTDERVVECMVYPCEVCDKTVALLIFAADAYTLGELEDYARIMHAKIKEHDVPTWIIGEESENIVNGEDLRQSLVLKVHPKRTPAKIMTPDDVMDKVDKLINKHCKA